MAAQIIQFPASKIPVSKISEDQSEDALVSQVAQNLSKKLRCLEVELESTQSLQQAIADSEILILLVEEATQEAEAMQVAERAKKELRLRTEALRIAKSLGLHPEDPKVKAINRAYGLGDDRGFLR